MSGFLLVYECFFTLGGQLQEHRCLDVLNTDLSVPSSVRIRIAVNTFGVSEILNSS